ncbi:MAG TPA: hypothetical protein VF062_20580 [Candidatus Limnocylindrales bacterium]
MRTVNVKDSGGADWAVRVVWQPRWRALARRFGGWRRKRREKKEGGGFDLPDVGGIGDDIFAAILVIVGLILFGLLFWFLLLPMMLLLVDIVIVVLLMLLAIPARVLLRRPWTVEAYRPGTKPDTQEWFATDVVGWRKALEMRDHIAQRLGAGHPPPVVGTLAVREA